MVKEGFCLPFEILYIKRIMQISRRKLILAHAKPIHFVHQIRGPIYRLDIKSDRILNSTLKIN